MANVIQLRQENNPEVIKRKHDILTVATQRLGYQLKKQGHEYAMRCPFHQDKTPSFMINVEKQIATCFGACGQTWDVIGLVQQDQALNYLEAVGWLESNIVQFPKNRAPQYEPEPEDETHLSIIAEHHNAFIWQWHDWLNDAPDVVQFLEDRGITKSWQGAARLGWTGRDPDLPRKYHHRLTIPWYDARQNLMAVKLREMPGYQYWQDSPKYFAISGGDYSTPYSAHVLQRAYPDYAPDVVFKVETELDALLINAALGKWCAIAKPARQFKQDTVRQLFMFKKMIVIPDNDAAGRADWITIKRHMNRAVIASVPEQYKDLGDYFDDDPGGCVSWLHTMAAEG